MKFALIGHPVAHSLSPAIHRAAYRELGVSHEYGLIDAASEDDVRAVVARVKSGDLSGVNVTIPWKRLAFAVADRSSALSKALGVANVLAPGEDGLMAHNTDALALESDFRRLAQAERAIVLGSGGAAPAVVAACIAAGIRDVVVTARRFDPALPEQAWPAALELGRLGARCIAWPSHSAQARKDFDDCSAGAKLVVQCTSAGMHGADSGEALAELLPWTKLPTGALAYDLIYAPLETPFLRRAREAGHRTSHGLSMLVGQAALAVEIWLGVRPPLEPLLAAALAALAERASR